VARTWLPDAVAKAVYARLHGLDPPDRALRPAEGATIEES